VILKNDSEGRQFANAKGGSPLKMFKILTLALALMAASASTAPAQVAGKWGFGGFISYTNPLFTFGERFGSGVDKWGLNASYVSSSRVTMEAEYHHADMKHGALESTKFSWSPKALTLKQYASEDLNPASEYSTRFNSVLISGLWFFNADRTMGEGSFSPYIVVGGGFYDHKTIADGIVWPGQSPNEAKAGGGGLDTVGDQLPSVVMNTQIDTRTAVTAAFGFGLEAFLTPTIALDVRGRYHFILSELRPYDAWGLDKSFPLQMVDLSAGFKFYFWE
jgi:opacity protein-like surface antigen